MKKKTGNFRLIPIDSFDARRGYARWVLPGVGTRTEERGSVANADLWVDHNGHLVTRFESQGYTLHFRICVVPEKPITDKMQNDIAEFLIAMLTTWIVDGVDDDLDCDAVLHSGSLA